MFSAKPMPTNPPVATVSPSRISATASRALTILPCSNVCSASSSCRWSPAAIALGLLVSPDRIVRQTPRVVRNRGRLHATIFLQYAPVRAVRLHRRECRFPLCGLGIGQALRRGQVDVGGAHDLADIQGGEIALH